MSSITNAKKLVAVIAGGYYRSGKGTFISECELAGSPVFETGKVMRALAEREPNNPAFEPVRRGQPVESGLVMNVAKRWLMELIVDAKTRGTIYFDSIPRLPDQLPFVDFLTERGYEIKVVWFTTPETVCDARPARDGRPEDTDPALIANRRDFYRNGTLLVLNHFKKVGMSESRGNLLEIDNTDLEPAETRVRIDEFLFGKQSRPAHSAQQHTPTTVTQQNYHIVHHPAPARVRPPAGVALVF